LRAKAAQLPLLQLDPRQLRPSHPKSRQVRPSHTASSQLDPRQVRPTHWALRQVQRPGPGRCRPVRAAGSPEPAVVLGFDQTRNDPPIQVSHVGSSIRPVPWFHECDELPSVRSRTDGVAG
jgi:hypothetical protein